MKRGFHYTGSVSNSYHWERDICPACSGTGERFFSNKRKMLEYLWEEFFGRNFLRFVRDNLIEKAKNHYIVKCRNCGGKGIYEEWY